MRTPTETQVKVQIPLSKSMSSGALILLPLLVALIDDNTRGYSGPEREDWALERESEINRLEKENEELRKLLKIDSSGAASVGASEEEWAGTDLSLGAPRRVNAGNFRGGSVAMGRKSSLMGGGRGTTIGGPSGFSLQRPTGLGWMDKHQDGMLR